jgi:hypothetical protein
MSVDMRRRNNIKKTVDSRRTNAYCHCHRPSRNAQKLRVAFERINALVGRGDNALVGEGYAQQSELTRFKANVEDPRHSGDDAVHGVHRGPLRASKMTKKEGFEFVIRLFNDHLQKNPA